MPDENLGYESYAVRVLRKLVENDAAGLSTAQLVKVKRAVIHEVERAVLEERQGLLHMLGKVASRKFEVPATRWCLEELIELIELRGATNETVVKALAKHFAQVDWAGRESLLPKNGDLGSFNMIAGTRYLSWDAAARAILLGEAPSKLDDDARVWDSVSRLRARFAKKPDLKQE